MRPSDLMIERVLPGSPAERAGVTPGSTLIALDGETPRDILDYLLMAADERIQLEWEDPTGKKLKRRVTKEYSDDLGLVFRTPTLEPLEICTNNCVFCFVRQLPGGLRDTLYLKDDDYRLSFLHGTFITLTNISEDDWRRILRLHLSPLYISVHTTNPELRRKMLKNPGSERIMEQLRDLTEAGIDYHTQIVLCPGWNDGSELERTLKDLKSLGASVLSVAVVPVGLTSYREGLPLLETWSETGAKAVLSQVEKWKSDNDYNALYLADEFFLKAGQAVPPAEYYHGYPQLENGVGLVRSFLDEAEEAYVDLPGRLEAPKRSFWVTGLSAAPVLAEIRQRLSRVGNLDITIVPVENTLFGKSVTVAGLMAGRDVGEVLSRLDIEGADILLPDVCLRDRGAFLDDVQVSELPGKVRAIPANGRSLVEETLKIIHTDGDC